MDKHLTALRWPGPPISVQVTALLLGSLVVAQGVTLALTLLVPPEPPPQYKLTDIAAALGGQAVAPAQARPLQRSLQPEAPAPSGPGWLTSERSRHDLAQMLGSPDDGVRLFFYTPLPFAGTAHTPPAGPEGGERLRSRRSDDDEADGRPRPIRADFLLAQAGRGPGGPGGPGGFGGPGSPGGPGGPGGAAGGRPMPMPPAPAPSPAPATAPAPAPTPAAAPAPAAVPAPEPAPASPAPQAPAPQPPPSPGADNPPAAINANPAPANPPPGPPRVSGERDGGGGPARQAGRPDAPAAAPAAPAPASHGREAPVPASRAPAAPSAPAPKASQPESALPIAPAPPAQALPAPQRQPPMTTPEPAAPMAELRGLFGLAPAPFVEGDFIAAMQSGEGSWVVVQPVAAPFPNAWQRRVLLWFLVAAAVVGPLGWLFSRRLARPIASFAEAAERLGRDPTAPVLALEGPAEVGRAAQAFNRMQSRLASFVADRTAMIGAISHDLRTPLTRMRFRIEDAPDELRDGMLHEVEEMEQMISSVIAFTRDASELAGRQRLDLSAIVVDVVGNATAVGKDVRLGLHRAAPVEADAVGMRRLLDNLIENALKYGGHAEVSLFTERQEAVAEVRDDGSGLPDSELERVFEPFYRAPNARASGQSGTGLGLAVCRSIARAHGGDVRLRRGERGMVAQLRLPLAFDAGAAG
ncbi:MAG: ATP-binding protein [Rubrivivax sp.]